MSRLHALLVALCTLLLAAALVSGCGDDDAKDSTAKKVDKAAKSAADDANEEAAGPDEGADTPQPPGTPPPNSPNAPAGTDDAAGAKVVIVPGISIGGVALDMNKQQVLAVMGTPKSEKKIGGELGSYTDLTFKDGTIVRLNEGGTSVVSIETTDDGARTVKGGSIGVGSTHDEVVKAFSSIDCDSATSGVCRLGGNDAGSPVTDFFLNGGKVTRVTVGYVID